MSDMHTSLPRPPLPPIKSASFEGRWVLRFVSELKPYAGNARKHSKGQLRKLAASISEFGFVIPITTDADSTVLSGHGRLEAAKLLHLTEVPTICIDHLTDAQKKAFVIADNRLAELAQWDEKLLAKELRGLIDLDFSVQLTGFDTPDLDRLLKVVDDDDHLEPEKVQTTVVRLGDTFTLGRHRLHCGNSLYENSYEEVMNGERALMVFTDPPYNVPVAGHITVNGTHSEFAMASGEMSSSEFTQFLGTICGRVIESCVDGALHFICMDWRHQAELLEAARPHYSELKNLIVWNKENAGMGSQYRSKHELIYLFKQGTAAHINNVELGRHGRYRTNVWTYPGATSMSKDRQKLLAMHPTVKPVAMIADAILDCTNRGDLVLDPFGGSGSTLMAAEKVDRRAALIELDPGFVEATIRRFEERTGSEALHVQSGLSWAALKASRETETALVR